MFKLEDIIWHKDGWELYEEEPKQPKTMALKELIKIGIEKKEEIYFEMEKEKYKLDFFDEDPGDEEKGILKLNEYGYYDRLSTSEIFFNLDKQVKIIEE